MKFSSNFKTLSSIILISSLLILFLGKEYIEKKENKILINKYDNISKIFHEKVQLLIDKKRNATLALTLALTHDNENIKKIILEDYKYDLKEVSEVLKNNTEFKNIWFHIVDKNGVSKYRSWTDKIGDNIREFRNDIDEILTNHKTISTISVGKYDITFKAMVPIFHKNEFIGFFETISHFESLVENIRVSNKDVNALILVNKEFTKQLNNSLTKTFIQDHYIINLDIDKVLLEYIKKENISDFLTIDDYIIKDDFIIINNPVIYKDKKLANILIFKKIDTIDMSELNDFRNHTIIYLGVFLIVVILTIFAIFYYFYSKKLKLFSERLDKNRIRLQKLNDTLQITVEEEVRKNEEKNKLLFQQNKMAAMGEMVENIAHQWRQPLSLITTEASAIKVRKEFDLLSEEELFKSVESIIETSNYLSHTIDDFRNYFSPTKNKNFFNSSVFIKKCTALVKNQLVKLNIKLIENIKDIEINSYENELIQIIINVINNAKDALSSIDINSRILFINLWDDEENIYISIKDTAGGIEEEILDRVFEPYFTTKHQSKGTGIGLYMCQQIMSKHIKGDIKVQNEEFVYDGKTYVGALFLISIPKD